MLLPEGPELLRVCNRSQKSCMAANILHFSILVRLTFAEWQGSLAAAALLAPAAQSASPSTLDEKKHDFVSVQKAFTPKSFRRFSVAFRAARAFHVFRAEHLLSLSLLLSTCPLHPSRSLCHPLWGFWPSRFLPSFAVHKNIAYLYGRFLYRL